MYKRRMFLLLSLAVAGFGCSQKSEIEKVAVSGTVTRDGKPIPKGMITFFPKGKTQGPVSGTQILDGKYTADAKGGVPVGTHRVAFHEVVVDPNRDPTLPPPLVENNILPTRYNEDSTVELTVESGDPIVKDFDLDKEFGPLSEDKKSN